MWKEEIGVSCYRAAKKPNLTEGQKEQRLGFALEHINTDWSNYIFVDEKTFHSDATQMKRVYRPPNSRYEEPYILPNQRSGRICAGVWGLYQ